MKRLLHWLIRLYPRAWRDRYEEEFAALIDDSPPRRRMIFDLVKGAFAMQFAMPNLARVFAAMTVAGVAAGFAASYAVTPRYESHAQLVFSSTTSQPSDLVIAYLHYRDEVMSRLQLSTFIQDPGLALYENEIRTQPIEDLIEDMRARVRFEMTNASARALQFRVAFTFSDPEKTKKTIQQFCNKLLDLMEINRASAKTTSTTPSDPEIARLEARIEELERRFAGKPPQRDLPNPLFPTTTANPRSETVFSPPSTTMRDLPPDPSLRLSFIEGPTLPTAPLYPNRVAFAASGAAAGFAISLLMAFVYRLRRSLRPTQPAVLQ